MNKNKVFQSIKHPSIGAKFVAFCLAITILGVINVLIVKNTFSMLQGSAAEIKAAGRLRSIVENAESTILAKALGVEKTWAPLQTTLDSFDETINILRETASGDNRELQAELEVLRSDWVDIRTDIDGILGPLAEGKISVDHLDHIHQDVVRIFDRVTELDVAYLARSREIEQRALDHLYWLALINATWLLAGIFGIRVYIIKPLKRVTDATRSFSAGHYQARTGLATRDEIGEMGRAFDQMADEIERDMDRIAADMLRIREKQQESRKLSQAVELSPASVLITDPNGIIEYVNPKFCDATGYTSDEVIGKKTSLLSSGHTPAAVYRDLWQTILSGKEWSGELLNRKKDGDLFWERTRLSSIKDETGRITHFISVKEDVTARKRMEERLRLLSRSIEASINSIIITEAAPERDNPIIYVNPAFERLTGYTWTEAMGRNCRFLQGDDKDQPGIADLHAALAARTETTVLLRNYRKDGSLFWNELYVAPVVDDKGAVTHFVGVMNDVTERIAHQEQLQHQASHDALTGLPNRVLLYDRIKQGIAQARRQQRNLAVLFLDIDHFKDVNDSFGHRAGDHMIQDFASRLAACVREADTVARLGGDEFVVVLPDLGSDEPASVIAQKLIAAMADPFLIDQHELHVTTSIGVALYPRDGDDYETLIMHADTALYKAKELGRATFQFHSGDINAQMRERLTLTSALRHAIERKELELHYQPRVDFLSGSIKGMEALLRWTHPDYGVISPLQFIPLAEESGLILSIGEWVLRTACAQNKSWQDSGLQPIRMAVNLSSRQFRQHDLAARIGEILAETRLDPDHLELEITESVLMDDTDGAIRTLREIKQLGVSLAIDDFGTGYSSLSYLRRFPIDTLKIDRSFVKEVTSSPDDAVIAKTIIAMAHEMRLTVVAEGVETEAQRAFLALRFCDEMQGYYFSRPLAAAMATRILARQPGLPLLPSVRSPHGQRELLIVTAASDALASLSMLLRHDDYRIFGASGASEALQLLATNPIGVILSDHQLADATGIDFLRRSRQLYPQAVRILFLDRAEADTIADAATEGVVDRVLTEPRNEKQLRMHLRDAFAHFELVIESERASRELASVRTSLERLSRARTEPIASHPGIHGISHELVERIPTGLIGIDADGQIVIANHMADELLGADDESPLLGQLAAERLPETVAAHLESCIRSGTIRRGSTFVEALGRVNFQCCPVIDSASPRSALVLVSPCKCDLM